MSTLNEQRYWPVARDKPGLLRAMMRVLSGDAHISFEGDLSRCNFDESLHPTFAETAVLKRNTLVPKQDFVVVPLPVDAVMSILAVVLPDNRFMKDVLHIQIESGGLLQFGSYDQFHPECIVCYSPGISPSMLDQLKASGVIRSWSVPKEGAQRWHG